MSRVIERERLPYHPRLGRSVNHDSESRRYAIPERDVPIKSVQHRRSVPIFDQGDLGSCTGNAGVGCTGTGSFYGTLNSLALTYAWDESGAVGLYGRATAIDSYAGTYPPDDTGSDGLSVAKALKEAGEISGYLWAFTPDAARQALMSTPLITGISWYEGMFNSDPSGQVTVSGPLAGGHEIVIVGYVPRGTTPSNDDRVWFDNSWGTGWGVSRPGQPTAGSFWMAWGAYAELLADNGDVTQFVPISQPAPTPTPVPPAPDDPDAKLWADTHAWRAEHHVGDNAKAAKSLKAWGASKGFS